MKPKLKRKVFKGWFDPNYHIHNGKLSSGDLVNEVRWFNNCVRNEVPVKITVEWKQK